MQYIFQLFKTMCYQFFRKESTYFTTKTRFSIEFSQHYWQESFDGDSFVSQSRFDAYVVCTTFHFGVPGNNQKSRFFKNSLLQGNSCSPVCGKHSEYIKRGWKFHELKCQQSASLLGKFRKSETYLAERALKAWYLKIEFHESHTIGHWCRMRQQNVPIRH